jgi:hypothetical protein
MSRAHALTVRGAARFAISSYSASVTFVLIERVRGVGMEHPAGEKRANVRSVSELPSFQWLPFRNLGFYLEADALPRNGKLCAVSEFRIRYESFHAAPRRG